jgi:translation initiation factor 5
MAYYQLDVLDEDIAKHWGTHVSKKYTDKETSKSVRLGAKKFLEVCVALSLVPGAVWVRNEN